MIPLKSFFLSCLVSVPMSVCFLLTIFFLAAAREVGHFLHHRFSKCAIVFFVLIRLEFHLRTDIYMDPGVLSSFLGW